MVDRNAKNVSMARTRVRMYLEEFFRTDLLESVTAERLLEYRVWLGTRTRYGDKPLARETVPHVLADARCMFRWLEEHGYVAKAPLPRRFLPKRHKVTPRWLSEAEVAKLLARLDGP